MNLSKEIKKINIYDFTIGSLLLVAIIGIISGNFIALWQVILAPVAAGILDYLINRFVDRKEYLPKSAIISGLIISLVITPGNLLVAIVAAILAIISKHIIIYSKKVIFNPAALGIVISIFVFKSSDGWWGASLSLAQPATFIMVILALIASWKLGKLPLSIAYVLSVALITSITFGPFSLLSVQGLLSLFGGLFFAGFMLTDPRTSGFKLPAMIIEGILVLFVSTALVYLDPSLAISTDGLLLSLLGVNTLIPLLNNRLK